MVAPLPFPLDLTLHFSIGDIVCDCAGCCTGCCMGCFSGNSHVDPEEATSELKDENGQVIAHVPVNKRVVLHDGKEHIHQRSNEASLPHIRNPWSENRETIRNYYEHAMKQLREELDCPVEDNVRTARVMEVISSGSGLDLHQRYQKRHALKTHHICHVVSKFLRAKNVGHTLCDLVNDLAEAKFEKALSVQGSPLTQVELMKIGSKLADVPAELLQNDFPPPPFGLTADEGEKLLTLSHLIHQHTLEALG